MRVQLQFNSLCTVPKIWDLLVLRYLTRLSSVVGKATGNPFLGSTWSLGHYHSRKSPVEKFMSLFPFLILSVLFFASCQVGQGLKRKVKKSKNFQVSYQRERTSVDDPIGLDILVGLKLHLKPISRSPQTFPSQIRISQKLALKPF